MYPHGLAIQVVAWDAKDARNLYNLILPNYPLQVFTKVCVLMSALGCVCVCVRARARVHVCVLFNFGQQVKLAWL